MKNPKKKFLFHISLIFGLCAAFSVPSHAAETAEQYSAVFDPAYYAAANPDVAAALGNDQNVLLQHFLTNGMAEGRQGCASFNVFVYAQNYPDLVTAFGADLPAYYQHYITNGRAEGRVAAAETAAAVGNAAGKVALASEDPAENEVYLLTNKYRRENGVALLSFSDELNKAADIRAKELSQSYSHVRPNGSSWFTVMDELGISRIFADENIALGQWSAEMVTEAWMNSPEHREKILTTNFNKIGVGHYNDGNGSQYWVQLFTS